MKIITEKIEFSTKGNSDIVDLTSKIQNILSQSGLVNGNVLVFAVGSTLSISTIEYEPGLIKDLPDLLEKLIPSNRRYYHDDTWGDGNGHSHLRATLFGPSLTIPFTNRKLLLGTWQQVICIDFDTRSRRREVIIQLTGE